MSMHRFLAGSLLLSAAVTAGCGGGRTGTAERATPMPADLAGAYAGDWPCSNCDTIEATLWLRPDHRFFLRQTFVGGEPAGDDSSYSIGVWQWDERAAEVVLRTVGPERRFALQDARRLELHTFSKLPHVLARLDTPPPFTDVVRLDGESAFVDGGATFTECLSGLSLAVVPERGFEELSRKHRLMNSSGKPALTTVEGHLSEIDDDGSRREVLVVDRVIALTPGAACRERP
jgi:hypothetical protein